MGLDVTALEGGDQHVDALRCAQVPIDEDDVLAADPTRAAANAVAHLPQQHLFPHLHSESLRELLELVEQCIIAPAHASAT